MLCDKCKINPATFHSSVNINGNVITKNLCQDCASIEDETDFDMFINDNDNNMDDSELSCPNCGYTLTDFKSTGLLGCSQCYAVFRDIIVANLEKTQPNSTHIGKTLDEDNLSDLELKIKKLEIQLKQAVNEEDYELASRLKQQIIALKENADE